MHKKRSKKFEIEIEIETEIEIEIPTRSLIRMQKISSKGDQREQR